MASVFAILLFVCGILLPAVQVHADDIHPCNLTESTEMTDSNAALYAGCTSYNGGYYVIHRGNAYLSAANANSVFGSVTYFEKIYLQVLLRASQHISRIYSPHAHNSAIHAQGNIFNTDFFLECTEIDELMLGASFSFPTTGFQNIHTVHSMRLLNNNDPNSMPTFPGLTTLWSFENVVEFAKLPNVNNTHFDNVEINSGSLQGQAWLQRIESAGRIAISGIGNLQWRNLGNLVRADVAQFGSPADGSDFFQVFANLTEVDRLVINSWSGLKSLWGLEHMGVKSLFLQNSYQLLETDAIGACENLTSVQIYTAPLLTVVGGLITSTSIQSVQLDNVPVTNLTWASGLQSLVTLQITTVSKLKTIGLSNVPNLREFSLACAQNAAGISTLDDLSATTLTVLSIFGCTALTSLGATFSNNLQSLTTLGLSYMPLTSFSFPLLTSLDSLSLSSMSSLSSIGLCNVNCIRYVYFDSLSRYQCTYLRQAILNWNPSSASMPSGCSATQGTICQGACRSSSSSSAPRSSSSSSAPFSSSSVPRSSSSSSAPFSSSSVPKSSSSSQASSSSRPSSSSVSPSSSSSSADSSTADNGDSMSSSSSSTGGGQVNSASRAFSHDNGGFFVATVAIVAVVAGLVLH